MKVYTMRIGVMVGALGLLAMIAHQANASPVTGTYSLGTDPNNAASGSGTGPFELTSSTAPSFTYSFVNFIPSQPFTLNQLTSLSLDFIAHSGYSAGSPRVAINLQGNDQLLIYFAPPNGAASDMTQTAVQALSNVNLLGLTDNRVESSALPNNYQTYQSAIGGFGSEIVRSFTVITDNGAASLTLNGINANAVPEPATLVSGGFACLVGVGYGLRRRKNAKKNKV